MSRLDDDLTRDLEAIASRVSPSPDAWSAIQQRIADRAPQPETEIIMLTENTFTRRRWPLVAAAAAVVALAVGAIALVNRDDTELPADQPTPTVAPSPQPDAEASAVPATGDLILPGRYETDLLGVPMSFEVPADTNWDVWSSDQNVITIGTAEALVGFTRIGSFYDGDEGVDPDMSGLGSIPPDAVDAWIESTGVSVDADTAGSLGGRDARFVQVRVPADADWPCPPEELPCLHMGSGSADLLDVQQGPIVIGGELPHAFWFVDMGDFEPVRLRIYTNEPDGMTEWLDEVAPMLDSLGFGEPAAVIEDGTARLSTFEIAREEQAVTDYLNAFFGGDVDTALDLVDPADADGALAGEIEFQGLIGARVEVGCRPSTVDGAVDCDVAYRNDLYEVVGAQPDVVTKTFEVDDGTVATLDSDYPADTPIMDSMIEFLVDSGQNQAFEQACEAAPGTPYTLRPAECAALITSNLADWAIWRRDNGA